MGNQLLLIEDVDDLGRSGDIVAVKPGYARNYLLPEKKAIVATKNALRMQARLKEERAKRAEVDKKEAEVLAGKITGMTLTIEVKIDPEGHMYGSVNAMDIARLFEQEGIKLEKRNVVLLAPIKELGVHQIQLKLKEGVPASFTLQINSDSPMPVQKVKESRPKAATEDEEEGTDKGE